MQVAWFWLKGFVLLAFLVHALFNYTRPLFALVSLGIAALVGRSMYQQWKNPL